MIVTNIEYKDFLSECIERMDVKKQRLLKTDSFQTKSFKPVSQDVSQSEVFRYDVKRHIHTFTHETTDDLLSIAQAVATSVAAPFALFVESYRLCKREITFSTCLRNISKIPLHLISAIFKTILLVPLISLRILNTAFTGLGFLAWHSGEWVARHIKGSSHTVLSNRPYIRDIVYESIGFTLGAAALVFAPIAPIQLVALPILFGSLYGTINNQFTVRKCPEYYTMGHYYDGTNLEDHAIKTNNLFIKPIITGCYATTTVTQIAGYILAAVGTLPYTVAMLPISYASFMIAGVCAISLMAAHVISKIKEHSLQKNLNAYADLVGFKWTNENHLVKL